MGLIAGLDARCMGTMRVEHVGFEWEFVWGADNLAGVSGSATGYTRVHLLKVLNEARLRRGTGGDAARGVGFA
jgi:hypothetical protein